MKGLLDRSSILLISTNFKPISIVDVGFFMQFFLNFCIFTCYHPSCKKKHFNRWPNYFLGGWYNVSDFQQCFFLDCRTCWNRFFLPYFMKDEHKKLMLQSVFGAVCVVANVETMITDIILGNCYAVSFVLIIFWSIITVVLYEFAKYDKVHMNT